MKNKKLSELLELRRAMKARKPAFGQQDSYKRGRVGSPWRRPKGLHAKMRKNIHGKPAVVSKGYKGPKNVRGLDRSGLARMLIHTIKELEWLNPKQHGVLLANVGMKKKQALLQACKDKGLCVLNAKSIDAELSRITERLAQAKQAKDAKAKKKAETAAKPLAEKVEAEKETKRETKKEAEKDEKEKREQQRKEMEKVLIKRE